MLASYLPREERADEREVEREVEGADDTLLRELLLTDERGVDELREMLLREGPEALFSVPESMLRPTSIRLRPAEDEEREEPE